jgi:hypothetical protein
MTDPLFASFSTLPTFAVQISAKSGQNLSSLKTLLKELIDRANLTAGLLNFLFLVISFS